MEVQVWGVCRLRVYMQEGKEARGCLSMSMFCSGPCLGGCLYLLVPCPCTWARPY